MQEDKIIEEYREHILKLSEDMLRINILDYKRETSKENKEIRKGKNSRLRFDNLDYLPFCVLLINLKKLLYESLLSLMFEQAKTSGEVNHSIWSKDKLTKAILRIKNISIVKDALSFPKMSAFVKEDADEYIIDLVKIEDYLRALEGILSQRFTYEMWSLYSALKVEGDYIDFDLDFEDDIDEEYRSILNYGDKDRFLCFRDNMQAFVYYRKCFASFWAINTKKDYSEYYLIKKDTSTYDNWLGGKDIKVDFADDSWCLATIREGMPASAWLNDTLSRYIYVEYSHYAIGRDKEVYEKVAVNDDGVEEKRLCSYEAPFKELFESKRVNRFIRSCQEECRRLISAFDRVYQSIGLPKETVIEILRTTYQAMHKAYVLKVLEIFRNNRSTDITHERVKATIQKSRKQWDSIVNKLYSLKVFTIEELDMIQDLISPAIKQLYGLDIALQRIER